MPQVQNPAGAFLLILALIWLFFPESDSRSQSLALSDIAVDRVSRYRDALGVLNATKWGDFSPRNTTTDHGDAPDAPDATTAQFLNLTGFRERDGLAWDDLEAFRQKGLRLSRHAVPPVDGRQLWDAAQGEAMWMNASGTVLGEWVRRPGSVARGFQSYNLTRSVPNVDWVGHNAEWARNVTGDSGRITLRLHGNRSLHHYEQLPVDMAPLSGGIIRSLHGTAGIEDTTGSGLNWEMKLWGVHWPRQGVMLMTTTSEKFEGIFALPHLSPGPDFFQSSQMLLNQTLANVIRRKEKHGYVDQQMPWNSDVDNPMYTAYPSPHCEYIVYAQVHPPLPQKYDGRGKPLPLTAMEDTIRAIESELQSPVGAPIPRIPPLQISAVMYSPDCSFFLETRGSPDFPPGEGAHHLVGTKKEVHTHQIKTWLLLYALVVLGQVRLLRDQMKESFTPSTMGRVSFGTISMMLIVDGMTFTAAATWVSSATATFLPTLALMFSAFLSMTLGGSFLAKIHEVQLPERRPRQTPPSTAQSTSHTPTPAPPLPRPRPRPPPPPPNTGSSLLPGPAIAAAAAAAAAAATPAVIIIPSDQDMSAELADSASAFPTRSTAASSALSAPAQPQPQPLTFQAIIGRFILFSLCISFLGISSSTWYPLPRSLFLNACAAIYLSFWVPQIYRNTLRNCRRALAWPFIAGQSLLRLLPIAYFWVKRDNFLYANTDPRAFVALAAWVWLQVVVLAAQQIISPRLGIPMAWTPDVWDYHPILRDDNLEADSLPIGLVPAAAPEDRPGAPSPLRQIDCAICREVLQVPVIKPGESATSPPAPVPSSSIFARRMYMVTPCRHIFHTACLESWLRFRLQCPICREELPPV
ncbi:hypothetical protein E4U42_004143 [Claviceps africana]|uniref:DSC E3 ubiquitin ligase complex subunit A n=1 Tax=Claviceps africana TaxID=83212 RepID=A0A8K0NIF6_9HYPO|nr:hypothetical protein E4U42_004143 [Claviceps africana]